MLNQKTYHLLVKLSQFLNLEPCPINEKIISQVKKIVKDSKRAYIYLLKEYLDLDAEYDFDKMINHLNPLDYTKDEYYQNIKFDNIKENNWELKESYYQPYECFVMDDFIEIDGDILPVLGYFDKKFKYPAIYQNNILWMSVTPNEINTMANDIKKATGKVITVGLGLGYYAYHVSLKDDVDEVIIIEKDQEVIELFKNYILPKFKNKTKIKIYNQDAFCFFRNPSNLELLNSTNYIFIDIWHDVSDGLPLYQEFKKIENELGLEFHYWIEKTMKHYM